MTHVLGKYQLIAEIARGGMGIVHLAVTHGPARFSKLLVVKELKPELAEDPAYLEMFLEEARLAARLNHPNIVQTYEVGAYGQRHYIVMDYLEGVPLARILRKKTDAFTLAMQLRVICDALRGLSYAHTLADFDGTPLGIVHRDATPQNVFITYDGQVKLVDFGIARAHDSSVETQQGILKGKPAYMAPEQIAGEVDARADVYAMSVVLWEAIAGRRMWHKKSDVEVLTSVFKGEVPSLRAAKPDVDEALLKICEKGLAKNRDDRFESAQALANALEAYMVARGWAPSMREVGQLVSDMFAKERASVRAIIDGQLQSLRSGWNQDEKLPVIVPTRVDNPTPSRTGSIAQNFGPAFNPGNPGVPVAPQSGTLVTGMTGFTGVTGVTGFTGTGPTPAGSVADVNSIYLMREHNRWRKIALGSVAALLVIGAVIVTRFTDHFGDSPPTAAPTAAAAPDSGNVAPAAAPSPGVAAPSTGSGHDETGTVTHEIRVTATPATAEIAFNDITYANPATAVCKHGDVLILRVNANGYSARERRIDCNSDEVIELALTAVPHGHTWTPHTATPHAAPPPADAAPAAPPAPKADCNPPFYFEGDKKVFKPGCL